MSGYGAISEMLRSIKANKKLIGKKKSLRDHRDSYVNAKASKPMKFTDSMTEDEHFAFQSNLKKRARNSTLFLALVITLVILLTLAFLYYINSTPASKYI